MRPCYDAQALRHATSLHGSSSLIALTLNGRLQSAESIRFQASPSLIKQADAGHDSNNNIYRIDDVIDYGSRVLIELHSEAHYCDTEKMDPAALNDNYIYCQLSGREFNMKHLAETNNYNTSAAPFTTKTR